MSTALDVLDILDLDEAGPRKSILDKDALMARTEKKKNKTAASTLKRPGNVPREVWGLQSSLNSELPPLMPTDDSVKYRQPKAVIGVNRVRRWYWTPFTNSARKDGLVLYHWRRENPDAAAEDYPFARYNKHATVPDYTHAEYESFLQDPRWSEEKTGHLMELARQFDVRFVVMRDRWDSCLFPPRPSVEDLKERYYDILAILDKERGTNLSKGLRYDAAHERRRKQQLSLLYGRTRDQVEQEQRLVQELKKIEARRREREKKKQDLQKLISQADTVVREQERLDLTSGTLEPGSESVLQSSSLQPPVSLTGGSQKKRGAINLIAPSASLPADGTAAATANTGGASDISISLSAASASLSAALTSTYMINFPDPSKTPGVHLRSQKMKLPSNLGQKKIRIIENFLAHLQIDPSPPATAEIVEAYNALRSKILLLYDLRMAQLHCDYELQTARLRLETFTPDQPLPTRLLNVTTSAAAPAGSSEQTTYASSPQIDPAILTALRDADSKRAVLPRHSLGIAGSLTAATGTSVSAENSSDQKRTPLTISTKSGQSSSGSFSGLSSSVLSTSPSSPATTRPTSMSSISTRASSASGSVDNCGMKRRRRAAALEQGRVLKKLKIKGQLVDQ